MLLIALIGLQTTKSDGFARNEAGKKVGPDQLGPPVRVASTRIDSDQLGSNKKVKIK